jgi:ectoine hydroxylase-related dioxygenase (phytanoyl-CoA dioxygenase family)
MNICDKYNRDGYCLLPEIIPRNLINEFYCEVKQIGKTILGPEYIVGNESIDEIWSKSAEINRAKAAVIYDAVKHSIALRKISVCPSILDNVMSVSGAKHLALVDLNVRIDAPKEDCFLFSWHQDYWFSICSSKAIVVWIPLVQTDRQVGGINIIPESVENSRILKVKRNPVYTSYSNSILLDEEINDSSAVEVFPNLSDALMFKFTTLHKSMQNLSVDRCRWTLQLRFANYDDSEFAEENYRPGVVNREKITYLDRIESKSR